MAPTFAGVVAATLTALCAWVPVLPERLVETVAGRIVNTTAETLAGRRGVQFRRPIVVRILDRPHMRAAREALSQAPQSPEAVRDQSTLQGLLGLDYPKMGPPARLPPDVSGLYDAVKGHLLMGNWVDLRADRFVLTRDVALAVLDRRFDLQRWLTIGFSQTKSDVHSDAVLARQALVEGDVSVQALEQVDPRGILPPPRALAEMIAQARAAITSESAGNSPLGLGQRLFVELDGLAFVAQMRDRAAWSTVDAVWAHPPQSTEQVLHPEKYEKRESPDDIGSRLPLRLRGQWQVSLRDTFGELGARIFLTRAVNDYHAERAATGWGGDTALLIRGAEVSRRARGVSYPNGDAGAGTDAGPETFAAWITTWDDDTDAEDFSMQAAHVLAALARASVIDDHPSSGHLRLTDAAGRVYVLDRRHRTVGMLFAAPTDAEATLSALMVAATARAPHRGTRQGRALSR